MTRQRPPLPQKKTKHKKWRKGGGGAAGG